MTVLAQAAAVTYIGDGVVRAYTIPFEMRSQVDLLVYFDRVLQGANYLITGDVTAPGATLTFSLAPAAGVTVLITRATPLSQDTVYTAHSTYKAKQHEQDFDKAILIAQELRERMDNPPLGIDAVDVNFAPYGNILSTNVQLAIQEVEADVGALAFATTKAIKDGDNARALISTKIISADTDTLQVLNPTLADDVTLVPKTNIPLGLVKLGADGRIPPTLIGSLGLAFKGTWNPGAQGSTPPAVGNVQGDFYIFEATGNMTLAEQANTTPHTVAVLINDQMIYDAVAGNWFYVHAGSTAIITAAGVLFVPVGTLGSTNVQAAIAELDDSISQRFKETGDEVALYRQNGTVLEPVLLSAADGVRLLRNSADKFQTYDYGVIVYGRDLSSAVAQNAHLAIRSADGVGMGLFGFGGDASLYMGSYKPGSPISLFITNAAGNIQGVLAGYADGATMINERGLGRFGITNSQTILYSANPASEPAPVCMHVGQNFDGAALYRTGFIGSINFVTIVDKVGAGWQVQLANGQGLVLTPTGGFAATGSIGAGGQVSAAAPFPTAPEHLTRKDYVDQVLIGAGSYDSIKMTLGAPFTVTHNLGTRPRQIWGNLLCLVPQLGYVLGDEIELPLATQVLAGSSYLSTGYSVWADIANLGFTTTGVAPFIVPKGGGAMSALVEANWQVVLHARK